MGKEETKIVRTGGPGLATLLTVVFVVLKLVGVISWKWIWVFAPLWIGFGVAILLLIFFILIAVWIGND